MALHDLLLPSRLARIRLEKHMGERAAAIGASLGLVETNDPPGGALGLVPKETLARWPESYRYRRLAGSVDGRRVEVQLAPTREWVVVTFASPLFAAKPGGYMDFHRGWSTIYAAQEEVPTAVVNLLRERMMKSISPPPVVSEQLSRIQLAAQWIEVPLSAGQQTLPLKTAVAFVHDAVVFGEGFPGHAAGEQLFRRREKLFRTWKKSFRSWKESFRTLKESFRSGRKSFRSGRKLFWRARSRIEPWAVPEHISHDSQFRGHRRRSCRRRESP